jgi:hypothetical protein
MFETRRSAADVITKEAVSQITNQGDLGRKFAEAVRRNPDKMDLLRGGKLGMKKFLFGQAMKATNSQANPRILEAVIDEILGANFGVADANENPILRPTTQEIVLRTDYQNNSTLATGAINSVSLYVEAIMSALSAAGIIGATVQTTQGTSPSGTFLTKFEEK